MRNEDITTYLEFFREVGIIEQLSRSILEGRLADGVGMAHFRVILHLVRAGDGQTPLHIAKAFQIPKTSLTHTLAGLEKRGMVEMRANPDDGRSKHVWVTEAGRHLLEKAMTAMAPDFEALSSQVTPERIAQLLPELSAIRAYLDTARD